MPRYFRADKIINDVAVESGLSPVDDVFASLDPSFIQMRYLLNGAGQEMLELFPWQILRRKHIITTDSATYPDQKYPLPDDFGYMIDQTGWDASNNLPLQGPMTPQQWAYLEGRNLASSTVYATFRLDAGEVQFFPAELSDGRDISFFYISRFWVQNQLNPNNIQEREEVLANTDVVMYEPILIKRMLKMKFLAAKGFDNSNATQEFIAAFDSWTGKSKGGQVLSASGGRSRVPLIDIWRNVSDSGYGV